MVGAREVQSQGVTLATAPVVVSGGRGVGSADGFEPLEELAELLGGVVGCSRVVTNNGWRPHADQVGQTGTRIAPDLYIATGISGAIQHWVGAMASKKILAINTDPEANMVTKADYAVIADLHAPRTAHLGRDPAPPNRLRGNRHNLRSPPPHRTWGQSQVPSGASPSCRGTIASRRAVSASPPVRSMSRGSVGSASVSGWPSSTKPRYGPPKS